MAMWRWALWSVWWASFMVASRFLATLFAYWAGDDAPRLWFEPGTTVPAFATAAAFVILGASTMTLCSVLLARLNGHHRT